LTNRLPWIIALTVLCAGAAWLLPAIPQPASYHNFADQRSLFGISNFNDVVSNVGFLIAGIAGLIVTFRPGTVFASPLERWPYAIFFLGLLLTAWGSSYYHLEPGNERLVWDRLPMTIAFMGLICAQIADRMSLRAGLWLLAPGIAVGIASVLYWRATEQAGSGNVVPYAVLQGYTMVILLMLAFLQPSRYTRGDDLYWVFFWYLLAKLFETFDRQIWDVLGVISGHTLKHLAAAVSGYVVVHMLRYRVLRPLVAATPVTGTAEA
jgi:hypothetical protein